MSGPDVRAIRTEDLPEKPFPEVTQSFRLVFAEEAFDRAVARGKEESDREIGGVLVGRLCRDAGGPYVRVDTTIDALHAQEKSTELTFTHATWAHVHEVMDRDHPDQEIVGWYHTHPGFGVFLSDRDVFIHRSFFDLPHQVALVYDPGSREHGVFAWRDGEPDRCRRYWIGTTEQTWEPPAVPTGNPTKTRERGKESDSKGPVSPPPLDRFSLGIGAIILLVLGGVVGWWFAGGSRGASLEVRRQEVMAAKLAGAEEIVKRLDLEVVELLRRSLDRNAAGRATAALLRLDAAVAELSENEPPPDEEARKKLLAEVRSAAAGVRALLGVQLGAALTLEAVAARRRQIDDPRATRRAVSLHAAALGQLFVDRAEDARKAGDLGRARRLLTTAILVDEGKRTLYEEKLAALGEDEEGEK